MACMKLGFKSNVFHLEGKTWLCSTGLPSDICIEVEETSFHLHKFPLLSRSRLLEKLIKDTSGEQNFEDDSKYKLQLHDIPGGAQAFLFIAKFCYGVKVVLTARNVVSIRCAAEHLKMSEDCGEGNLITHTENFLNDILGSWVDTIKALESSEDVLPLAEELHVVSRCIDSLAIKASADPSLFNWPVSGSRITRSPSGTSLWNGICTSSELLTPNEDWWHEDVSFLKLPLFKRLILAIGSKGAKAKRISGSVMFFAKRHLPLSGRQSSFKSWNDGASGSNLPFKSDSDQRNLLEEIVELLPNQKGVTPTKFLLKLLRISMILHASPSCIENLEKMIGEQLDEALFEDLLIPNTGYIVETLYDIDCVQRIIDHFMLLDQDDSDSTSNSFIDDEHLVEGPHSLTPMTKVASMMDNYLAEVAPDVNLKLTKFMSLAAAIPDYARPLDDGLYRAIDIYLKAHPWLTDSEKEQLCRLMNCQKFSLEASTHAAQNERLPLRFIVQVLFFEQLRLRMSVAGCLFVSDNLDNSQNLSGNLPPRNHHIIPVNSGGDQVIEFDDMQERVSELEKECSDMKQEIEKLGENKGSLIGFFKKFGLNFKAKSTNVKSAKDPCNGEVVKPSRKAGSDRIQTQAICKLDD